MPPASPPPIALTSLKIRDFRGIENLDLDFRGPDGLPNHLVVLAGPNGCGKTAVLEAALFGVGGHKLAVGHCDKRAIRKGAEDYEIQVESWPPGHLPNDYTLMYSSRTAPPMPNPKLPFWYFSSWRAPALLGAVPVSAGMPRNLQAKTDSNRLSNVKQQLVNAAAAQSFPGAKRPLLHNYSKWIAKVNEGWEKFYPDQGGEFGVDLVESEEESGGAFEVFYTREGSPPLSVDDLSAGQLELFLFLATLVLNDDREGIVFIDEPELHLDPQWHAPILRALMQLQPKAQFIIATHSPAIYDAAMSYERHFLVPEDDPRATAWPSVSARAEA